MLVSKQSHSHRA